MWAKFFVVQKVIDFWFFSSSMQGKICKCIVGLNKVLLDEWKNKQNSPKLYEDLK
jgi:hypothetical protein